MKQFFARVVELLEEKHVKYDGKITMDSPSREFLEMTRNLWYKGIRIVDITDWLLTFQRQK